MVSESLQWLCLLTLFLASVVTLIIYLVQYFGVFRSRSGTRAGGGECEEADRLLSWLLELKSWRTEWRRAWIRALNQNQNHCCSAQGAIQLVFEEDGVQSSELSVHHVSSFKRSPGRKDVQCEVIGDRLQFSLSACLNSGSSLRYSVKISPLQLQLALQMTEVDGEVQITWGLEHLDLTQMQLTPSYTPGGSVCVSEAAVKSRLQQVLCETRASVTLSSRTAQPAELKEVRNRISEVSSPPKPPRAHQWKLLVKNIRVTYSQEDGAAGSGSPQCVLQLDDPPQKMATSVLNDASDPVWDQPFIFELSGKSKVLNIQLLDHGKPPESCVLGEVCVPFNLVTRSPRGQHTFTLMNTHQVIGSLTTELSYLEPSEVRTWQPPTPAPAKRVEMDRTVMPCGTVVTTVTAVRSRPGRPLPTESMKPPPKAKLTERRVSEQPSVLGAKVSKALSASDTELLMLNGTDPVAEAAIRQLYESAKQKLKSPVKKSTIIISGVAKAPLSQDEMSLMSDYASTMDASMAESPECTRQETETLSEHCVSDTTDPLEGPSGADWESQTGEESDKASLSLCVSETRSKKGKGSFLHKGARLFFRRRQQRKEPGMSQSHNDLQYLEQAEERRTATFKRIINRKLLHKHKSKANGVQTSELHQPH
ncbi:C2 domain-containing protein 2 isoform X1 [Pangasianodon hypophthalmus]|uniref:C2 domain-containing protein 2 isoform X1 n=1 Tax=Pangasianodon hypophthalmus TaxID=310915 RepID=UPI0023082AB8|nr:C2 domain-containing protein 2 isoform X1 [Pangasianodon hypophthalmus]